MSQAIRVFGVCLLLAGLVVGGCGGDDDGSSTGGADTTQEAGESAGGTTEVQSTSESKSEYVAKANALCKKRREQIQKDLANIVNEVQGEEGSQQGGLRKLVDDAVAPGMEAEAEELRELGAPEGDEAQVGEIIAAIETVATEMRDDPRAFVNNPAAFAEPKQQAREYGIGDCGRAA